MSIQSNTHPGNPTTSDRGRRREQVSPPGPKQDNPPDRRGEGIKSMPKENAIDGKRPRTMHHETKGDKPGHHDNKDYDRMHAREPLPGDKEKAVRPVRAKDAPKGAETRRLNPERDRASR